MLARNAQKFKTWLFGSHLEELMLDQFKDNPMAAYLQVYFKQHRVITGLYRVLLLGFLGFVFLISLLIYQSLLSGLLPKIGFLGLGLMDTLLLLGGIKAFRELSRYKTKSQDMLAEVYEQLKRDLERLDKLKEESSALSNTQAILKNKLKFINRAKESIEEHDGWDASLCPYCDHRIDMMATVCPACGHELEDLEAN